MKTINAFTIHVNADHPEHVDFAFKLAAEYRAEFQRDVMVDVMGYRRLGHNEHDAPKFTQPKVYEKIDGHPKLMQIYTKQLVDAGSFTDANVQAKYDAVTARISSQFDAAKQSNTIEEERPPTVWSEYVGCPEDCKNPGGGNTSISEATFKKIGEKAATLPEGNKFHHLIQKTYDARLKSIQTGSGIDWATAESLAFGTLLAQGYGVRLSGEDVERGTFSHRHAGITDQETFEQYYPLDNLVKDKDSSFKFRIYNSLLSEYGVVGFDYGYSLGSPDYLTMWEAQFGDFSNCAQPIIDLYLANAEVKWGTKSGFVMLLPHGLDGQGPEHSSSRVERYLQLVNDDFQNKNFIADDDRQLRLCNFSVCSPSEPANYFHLLRRQLARDYRKPLVVLTPKRLLRLKEARNEMADFTEVQKFRSVLPDSQPADADAKSAIKKLYICTAQIYYELLDKRKELKRKVADLYGRMSA